MVKLIYTLNYWTQSDNKFYDPFNEDYFAKKKNLFKLLMDKALRENRFNSNHFCQVQKAWELSHDKVDLIGVDDGC
jgi:hypothetical protein